MSSPKIPRPRLVLYILIFSLLPHFFLLNNFLDKKSAFENSAHTAERLERELFCLQQRQALNVALAESYKGTEVRQREDLIEGLMQAKFIEGKMERSALLQEIPVQLSAPLKINTTELKHLLVLFDDRAIPPYEQKHLPALCLITAITLDRTEGEEKEQFLLNLKFMKREFF